MAERKRILSGMRATNPRLHLGNYEGALRNWVALQDEGCEVVGTVSSVKAALAQIADQAIDCAFLEINLGNEQVFPVADELAKRGVPFALLSGHTKAVVPPAHMDRPALPKPYLKKDVLRILEQLRGMSAQP